MAKELERDKLEPKRFEYLDKSESKLYAKVKNSSDNKDKIIRSLLERISEITGGSHCSSGY
jgi:hypothetical protein